jgi:hypothetical protein
MMDLQSINKFLSNHAINEQCSDKFFFPKKETDETGWEDWA